MAQHLRRSFLLWSSLILAAVAIPVTRKVPTEDVLTPLCATQEDNFSDLQDVRIYALVYYGRRNYVDILNAYLERNLRRNGGILDAVIWAMVKYDIEDINYLIMLTKRNPESYIIPWHMEGGGWDVIWRLADEPGAYYIKIDDDIVYIGDGAIAEMVREKRRGRFLFVSANVINHGILSAVHQEMGAIPQMVKPALLPDQDIMEQKLGPWLHQGDINVDPNFRIEHTFYSDCVWRRWDCGALAHEAFLWRLLNGSACVFDFGVFDFHSKGYETMSDGLGRSIDWNINFFVFAHDDFSDLDWEGIATDDEREFSSRHPYATEAACGSIGTRFGRSLDLLHTREGAPCEHHPLGEVQGLGGGGYGGERQAALQWGVAA